MLSAIKNEIEPRAMDVCTGPHPSAWFAAGANPVSISWKFALNANIDNIGTIISRDINARMITKVESANDELCIESCGFAAVSSSSSSSA
mmetsp:Transcript_6807/g.8443  ORF Transcript_6807/g.8443 Transcript_6807/m.8443 type:complete len:90 (-) Transcript_6807:343-612(-)